MAFQPMYDELRNAFLPYLFKWATSKIPGRAVTVIPVKQTGIALTDPTQTSGSNWMAFCDITGHLIA